MKAHIATLFMAIVASTAAQNSPFSNLCVYAISSFEYLGSINGSSVGTNGGFDLRFSDSTPDNIAIEDSETILNGQSWMLLACRGNIFHDKRDGFIIATAKEGPTFGRLTVYDADMSFRGQIDCQKVVQMQLVDLLGNGTRQIITREDHHYGTCTTKRMLNVYNVATNGHPQIIFTHDLVDKTILCYTNEPLIYSIDLDSQMHTKEIIVKSPNDQQTRFKWNGHEYIKNDG